MKTKLITITEIDCEKYHCGNCRLTDGDSCIKFNYKRTFDKKQINILD